MCCIFSVLKPLAGSRQSRCRGWTYKLPGGQKFNIKLSALCVGFSHRRPLNLIKRPQFAKLPRGAKQTLFLPYIKFLHCQESCQLVKLPEGPQESCKVIFRRFFTLEKRLK